MKRIYLYLYRFWALLRFIVSSRSIKRINDPAIRQLMNQALKSSGTKTEFEAIETNRKAFLQDQTRFKRIDFGAGSSGRNSTNQRISDIARHSLSRPVQCRFLFNLVQATGAKTILEMGTSLGISTAYIAQANPQANVITLEGDPIIAQLARDVFKKQRLDNIELVLGEFDQILPVVLDSDILFDLVYIDGNHTYDATLEYFRLLKTHVSKNALLIFDDIHWSPVMYKAWKVISSELEKGYVLDLYHMGLIVINNEHKGQSATIWPGWKWLISTAH